MILGSIRYTLGASAAAAFLAACGGSQPPIRAPGAMTQSTSVASRGHRSSEPAGALVYVSDLILSEVNAYNYPAGGRVLTLTGFTNPSGVCSDTNGNVFVLGNRNDNVIEYAHGAETPTQTLNVPGWASGCAYDPSTGNLAVVVDSQTYGTGVAIFSSEQGTPIIYYSGDGTVIWHCGYDDKSDLFCDGQTESVRPAFFALGSGSGQITQVPVSRGEFYDLGQIQWDGHYMAVTDTSFDTVSRITFVVRGGSGFAGTPGGWNGTVVGVTTLDECGYDEAWSSWIYDGSIVVACTLDSPYQNQDKGRILIWNYPQGGHRVKRIAKYETRPNLPDGVTISVSPSK
jgi:hypothetical protein